MPTHNPFAKDKRLVETRVRKNPLYKGSMVNFCVDDIRLPNGHKAQRAYLDHPGAVGVLPFLDRETIIMVRQYRYPVQEVTLELPAGKLDKGESALSCVRRELREETGYTARVIKPLVRFWPTPALANEVLHLYVAYGLVAGREQPDVDEFVEAVAVPFKKALGYIRAGKIKDSKTMIGLLACAAWRR